MTCTTRRSTTSNRKGRPCLGCRLPLENGRKRAPRTMPLLRMDIVKEYFCNVCKEAMGLRGEER